MKIDINQDHKDFIQEVLSKYNLIQYAYVFGSRVNFSARKYSDVDLLIKAPEEIDCTVLLGIKEIFEESDLPLIIDLVDWHSLTEEFQNEFMRKAVKLSEIN